MAGYPRTATTESEEKNLRSTVGIRAWHFVGGDPQSAGFCDGPGPGMALEQNPFLPPTRPGGANGKQCLNEPREQLNITSRCITRSLQNVRTGLNGQRLDTVQAKHLPSREELYNVALCYDADSGTDGDSKRRRSPGVIAPPLGGWEGLNSTVDRRNTWNGRTARDWSVGFGGCLP